MTDEQSREIIASGSRKQLPLDGFVLTEHRQFDADSVLAN